MYVYIYKNIHTLAEVDLEVESQFSFKEAFGVWSFWAFFFPCHTTPKIAMVGSSYFIYKEPG